MIYLYSILILFPLPIILNRWRGTGLIFYKITGVQIYSFYIGLLVGFLSTYYYGLLAGCLFLFGESFAWGTWVSYLCYPSNHAKEYDSKIGRNFPYIHYIANSIISQFKNYKDYCRVALTIRGFIWWTPLVVLFGCINLIDWYMAILDVFILSIGFPLACELAKYWNFEYQSKYLSIIGNWEKQEIIYGLIQFVCLNLSIFLTLYFKG